MSMKSLSTPLALVAGLLIGWASDAPLTAQPHVGSLSNLPTDLRPERLRRDRDVIVAFGPYGPVEARVLQVDRNGRWIEIQVDPGRAGARDLPRQAWVHIEQITLITRQ